MKSSAAPVYQLFKRADGPNSCGRVVAAMVVLATVLVGLGVLRVARQHEVLRLGYELARETEHVAQLREARRRLEIERATLSAPDRVRRLAASLGMAAVSPDRIRVVDPTAPPYGGAAGRALVPAVDAPAPPCAPGAPMGFGGAAGQALVPAVDVAGRPKVASEP
jgi:cell division protein FtsL